MKLLSSTQSGNRPSPKQQKKCRQQPEKQLWSKKHKSNDKIPNKTNKNNANNRNDMKPRTVYPSRETCGKTNFSTVKCSFGPNAANRLPSRNKRPDGQIQVKHRNKTNNSNKSAQAAAQNLI